MRAFTVYLVEEAAQNGHSLLSQKDLILKIRELPLEPRCEVSRDIMTVADEAFIGAVVKVELKDGSPAYQLSRLAQMGELIRRVVDRRIEGKRLEVREDWRKLLDDYFGWNPEALI